MSNRLPVLALTVLLLAGGLGLSNAPAPRRPSHDLDLYSDTQLHRDLAAELSEMYKHRDPNERVEVCELFDEAIEALRDDGDADDDDPFDDEIDWQDLVDEFARIHTTITIQVKLALGAQQCPQDGELHGPDVYGSGSIAESGEELAPIRKQAAGSIEAGLFRGIRAAKNH